MHHTVTARAPSAPEESCAAVGDVGRAAAAIAHQQLTSPPRLVMVMAHGTTAGNGQMSAYEAQSTDFRAVRVGFFFSLLGNLALLVSFQYLLHALLPPLCYKAAQGADGLGLLPA